MSSSRPIVGIDISLLLGSAQHPRLILKSAIEIFINLFFNIGFCCTKRGEAHVPKSLHGKTVLITGANSGIGLECAKVAAGRGAKVILACRDSAKSQAAVEEILRHVGPEKAPNLRQIHLDLSSLESVRSAAKTIQKSVPCIDVLLNNGGVFGCSRRITEDGFEYQFATNYLGHFLLTNLLAEKLRAAPEARIVNVSSTAAVSGLMDYDNLNLAGSYTPMGAYARSKLAGVLFTKELAKRFQGSSVTAYAVHPGLVQTDIWRHCPEVVRKLMGMFNYLVFLSPQMGAQTLLHAAFDPEAGKESGFFYE